MRKTWLVLSNKTPGYLHRGISRIITFWIIKSSRLPIKSLRISLMYFSLMMISQRFQATSIPFQETTLKIQILNLWISTRKINKPSPLTRLVNQVNSIWIAPKLISKSFWWVEWEELLINRLEEMVNNFKHQTLSKDKETNRNQESLKMLDLSLWLKRKIKSQIKQLYSKHLKIWYNNK